MRCIFGCNFAFSTDGVSTASLRLRAVAGSNALLYTAVAIKCNTKRNGISAPAEQLFTLNANGSCAGIGFSPPMNASQIQRKMWCYLVRFTVLSAWCGNSVAVEKLWCGKGERTVLCACFFMNSKSNYRIIQEMLTLLSVFHIVPTVGFVGFSGFKLSEFRSNTAPMDYALV